MQNKKSLKERLRSGEVCVGTHTYTASPAMVEMIGRSGFDWVLVDCEHCPIGPYDTLALEGLLRAAEVSGVTPVVRVPKNDEVMIMKVLDSGAAGVVVPHVNNADDARRAVRATRYPPDGTRGSCSNVRATGYYARVKDEGEPYWEAANERVLTVVLCEEYEACENIEAITDVPGVDVVYIGPRDMAMSMGERSVDAPRVREAMARMTEVCRRKGIAVGRPFYYPNFETAREMVREGANWLACTADVRIFYEACCNITKTVAAMIEPQAVK